MKKLKKLTLILMSTLLVIGIFTGCDSSDNKDVSKDEIKEEIKEELKEEIKNEVKEEISKEEEKEPVELYFDVRDEGGVATTIIASIKNNSDKEMSDYVVKFDFYKDGNVIYTKEITELKSVPANGGFNGEIHEYTQDIVASEYDDVKMYIVEN